LAWLGHVSQLLWLGRYGHTAWCFIWPLRAAARDAGCRKYCSQFKGASIDHYSLVMYLFPAFFVRTYFISVMSGCGWRSINLDPAPVGHSFHNP
jgi:hypothetical protein